MRDWLKKIRLALDLTQAEVAGKAGITQAYYAQIESGDRGNNLPVSTAKAIAQALNFEWEVFYDEPEKEVG